MPKASGRRSSKLAGAKGSRQVAAKHAVERRVKSNGRASKARLAEITAELDSQVSELQTLLAVKPAPLQQQHAVSVQNLEDIMRGL